MGQSAGAGVTVVDCAGSCLRVRNKVFQRFPWRGWMHDYELVPLYHPDDRRKIGNRVVASRVETAGIAARFELLPMRRV